MASNRNTIGMRAYREKRQMRNFMYSPLVLIVLALIVVFFARSAWHAYAKDQISKEGEQTAAGELADLETRKATLEKELEALKTASGVETELRNKFQVAWPGEQMIVLTQPESKAN